MTDNISALPDDTHLAYIVSHEAWYARTPGVVDGPSVSVSASAEGSGGGVAWEFVTEEIVLSGKPVIRVKIFDDAFDAFAQIPQFFTTLAKEGIGSLSAVRDLLDEMGAVDETDRVGPAGSREMGMRARITLSLEGLVDQEDRARVADRVMRALSRDDGQ